VFPLLFVDFKAFSSAVLTVVFIFQMSAFAFTSP